MTLVDFRGVRLSAQALLPISGDSSLIYGSCDAGNTIHCCENDPTGLALVNRLAEQLHLAPHPVVEYGTKKEKQVCMPVDIEVHQSLDDRNSRYVVDTARLLPPTAPTGKDPRAIFYQMFRPGLEFY
jgi:hypothetical protein